MLLTFSGTNILFIAWLLTKIFLYLFLKENQTTCVMIGFFLLYGTKHLMLYILLDNHISVVFLEVGHPQNMLVRDIYVYQIYFSNSVMFCNRMDTYSTLISVSMLRQIKTLIDINGIVN